MACLANGALASMMQTGVWKALTHWRLLSRLSWEPCHYGNKVWQACWRMTGHLEENWSTPANNQQGSWCINEPCQDQPNLIQINSTIQLSPSQIGDLQNHGLKKIVVVWSFCVLELFIMQQKPRTEKLMWRQKCAHEKCLRYLSLGDFWELLGLLKNMVTFNKCMSTRMTCPWR